MIVITMTNCPPKLRGDLTKWLCEINTGVYVGQVSARVREALWSRVCQNIKDGQATMAYSFANEQHLEFRTHNTSWRIRDFDGIKLMLRPNSPEQSSKELQKGFSNASKCLAAGRRQTAANSENKLAFIDIETTGLKQGSDSIIEIAVLISDKSKIVSSWSVLIKADAPIPPEISELTHITDKMLENGVTLNDALKRFSEAIYGKTVVCCNRKFDIAFLENAYNNCGLECPIGKVIDILPLARRKIADIENYKLESLAEYFGIPCEIQHRALADCETLYRVFLKLNEI